MSLTNFIKKTLASFSVWLLVQMALLGNVVYSFSMVASGRALDVYKPGPIDYPVLIGAKASYLDVAILYSLVFLAMIVGFYFRYRYYKDEFDLIAKTRGKSKSTDSGFFDVGDGDGDL